MVYVGLNQSGLGDRYPLSDIDDNLRKPNHETRQQLQVICSTAAHDI